MRLKNRYPQIPCISNYVAHGYAVLQQGEQYYNMLCETIRLFPEYFFGKLSLAEYYLNNKDYQKIPGIFDGKLEICHHLRQGAEVFHISEVRSFYVITGRYFLRSNNLARALFCYFTVEEIDPDHPAVRLLGDEIVGKELEKLSQGLLRHDPKKRKQKKRKR